MSPTRRKFDSSFKRKAVELSYARGNVAEIYLKLLQKLLVHQKGRNHNHLQTSLQFFQILRNRL